MFFSQNGGHQTLMAYPTIPYPSDPPLYEGFGDYSYPDSSPDASPTIAVQKGGDMNEAYEKYFISFDQRVGNYAETNRINRERIDRNRQNLEMNLNINDNDCDYDYQIRNNDTVNNSNLTTISEEGGNSIDSPLEQSVAQQF